MRDIRHFIDGAAFDGASGRFGDVFNPNTGEVQARVQLAGDRQRNGPRGSGRPGRLRGLVEHTTRSAAPASCSSSSA